MCLTKQQSDGDDDPEDADTELASEASDEDSSEQDVDSSDDEVDEQRVNSLNMGITSNTGDEFDYYSDDDYKDGYDAYNDINFEVHASMAVADDSVLDDDDDDGIIVPMCAPAPSPLSTSSKERGFDDEACDDYGSTVSNGKNKFTGESGNKFSDDKKELLDDDGTKKGGQKMIYHIITVPPN